MVISLTCLSAFVSILWVFSGLWEWTVPRGMEERINHWQRKWVLSQGIVSFMGRDAFEEMERFCYSLKRRLIQLEREFQMPVHAEIQMECQETLSDKEQRYFLCLERKFTGFTWHVAKRAE